jgi:hypothetical protein
MKSITYPRSTESNFLLGYDMGTDVRKNAMFRTRKNSSGTRPARFGDCCCRSLPIRCLRGTSSEREPCYAHLVAPAQARAWHEVENRAGAPDNCGHPFPRAERVQLWVECPSWELRDDVATVKAYQSVDKVRGGLGEREAEGH